MEKNFDQIREELYHPENFNPNDQEYCTCKDGSIGKNGLCNLCVKPSFTDLADDCLQIGERLSDRHQNECAGCSLCEPDM